MKTAATITLFAAVLTGQNSLTFAVEVREKLDLLAQFHFLIADNLHF